MFDFLAEKLQQRQSDNLFRARRLNNAGDGRTVNIDGQWLLNFSSNDYLGLQYHPQLKRAWQAAIEQYGCGSGASPLVSGYSRPQRELESYLAEVLARDAVMLFNSGFTANQSVIQGLMAEGGTIVADKLSHASILDGALASQGKLVRYKHNDMDHLQRKLSAAQGNCLVVTEGVFSMDGDTGPLTEIAAIAEQHQAWLMVDDAHGFGYLGTDGLGSCQHNGLTQQQAPVLMATFGKAIGTAGAFVAGSQTLIDYLVNFSRHYVYSTAIPPAQAAATLASLQLIRENPQIIQQLSANIDYFKLLSAQAGLSLLPSDSAIQPVLCGSSEQALRCSQMLHSKGILVVAIRPPTVPLGSSRLRVTLSAAHQRNDIEQLVEALTSTFI